MGVGAASSPGSGRESRCQRAGAAPKPPGEGPSHPPGSGAPSCLCGHTAFPACLSPSSLARISTPVTGLRAAPSPRSPHLKTLRLVTSAKTLSLDALTGRRPWTHLLRRPQSLLVPQTQRLGPCHFPGCRSLCYSRPDTNAKTGWGTGPPRRGLCAKNEDTGRTDPALGHPEDAPAPGLCDRCPSPGPRWGLSQKERYAIPSADGLCPSFVRRRTWG